MVENEARDTRPQARMHIRTCCIPRHPRTNREGCKLRSYGIGPCIFESLLAASFRNMGYYVIVLMSSIEVSFN